MGDYSTMLVRGVVRRPYRPFMRALYRTTDYYAGQTPPPGFLSRDGTLAVARETGRGIEPIIRAFFEQDRWGFTLRGSLAYVPRMFDTPAFIIEQGGPWQCNEKGVLFTLVSSKNIDTHRWYANRILPLVMRPGHHVIIGDLC